VGPRGIMALVEEEVRESLRVKQAFLQERAETLAAICAALAEKLERGGKLLSFGNGGSAADAQHIAAEFVGRYRLERAALPAMPPTVNSSTLAAVTNDYGYEEVFARQIEAFGAEQDAAIGISTRGNSPNVLRGGADSGVPHPGGHVVSGYCERVLTKQAAGKRIRNGDSGESHGIAADARETQRVGVACGNVVGGPGVNVRGGIRSEPAGGALDGA